MKKTYFCLLNSKLKTVMLMKKLLLFAVFALPFGAIAQAPNPVLNNPSFADWPIFGPKTFVLPPEGWYNSSKVAKDKTGQDNIIQISGYNSTQYAVQMKTVKSIADTVYGYVRNGDPISLKGGNHLTGAKPIQLNFAYEYNPSGNDEGIIYFIFTHQGALVDSIIFHPSTTSGWKAITVLLSLSQTPDNVIIGAASSNFFLNNGKYKGMPGSTLSLDEITLEDANHSTLGLSIDNGAFENWPTILYSVPDFWSAIGDTLGISQTIGIHSSSDGNSLELTTLSDGIKGLSAGVTNGASAFPSGRPYNTKYNKSMDTLRGWYLFDDAGTADNAAVNVTLIKGGKSIWATTKNLPAAIGNPKQFTIPINTATKPDSMRVEIWSSVNNNLVDSGNALIVDDLYLASDHFKAPKGIETFGQSSAIQAYPNPAKDIVMFKLPHQGNYSLRVFNALGQEVFAGKELSSQAEMQVSEWKSGMYFYRVTGNEYSAEGRFVKE
jgi:hypothetical protein